ncbi:protein kinase [Frigoribacterium sp. CFBP 8754]|uniref:protein kinase domain-containing protein n=1 Tax=Frigoribacterium sp. CFBP 8754 TaxID=2775290 RepID=UPI001784B449|nr:protein kinase [Frigoribacterium sp. CFBP 8754]
MSTSAPTTWIDELFVGETIGDFFIDSFLGHGQFGLVFEATYPVDGTQAAVKVLHPERLQSAHITDFENEGSILEKLVNCDGVVKLLGRGSYVIPPAKSGSPFTLTLPFQALALADGPLSDLCSSPAARAKVSLAKRLQLWRSAVLSLMRMHAAGVAHRDVKAENCLVFTEAGGKSVVRFGDFGRGKDLALLRSRPEDAYLIGRGDPFHAPPEAVFLQGGATTDDFLAADYYGLGSLLVELLTGQSMTQISIGDIRGARTQAAYDLEHGQVRDLAVLTNKQELVVESVVSILPKSVQDDARVLLATLCHPVASKRLVRGPYGKDQKDRESLTWVLRRIDIMTKRIQIDERMARRALERNS